MRFLKSNDQITIVPADKGNITVAMKKDELTSKIEHLLSDRNTYIITKDLTASLQDNLKAVIKNLLKSNYINEFTARRLLSNNAPTPPKLYALPKIHKPDCPVRPIASWVNTPTYRLSKFLADILRNAHDPIYNIKNSYEFQKSVTSMEIPENEILISYDVTSLYTNVPVDLVLCLINKNWNLFAQHTTIDKKSFMECMRLCTTKSNYFVYNGTFYQQTFGFPMGSPLSPIAADIVMTHLLMVSIPRFSFTPKFMFKYVDDLISTVPPHLIEETINILNNYNERIKFTYETEEDQKLNYLDVQLIRREKSIETRPFVKPSSKLRVLNYLSFHPTQHKMNIINGTVDRLLNLTSPSLYKDAEKLIFEILSKNNYPMNAIKIAIKRHHENIEKTLPSSLPTSNTSNSVNIENEIIFSSISYVPNLTEKIKNTIMSNIENNQNLKIAFRIDNSIKNHCFSKLKDVTKKEKQSNLVYEITCTCNKKYIGQTSNYLKTRLYGHKADIKKALNVSTSPSTPVIPGQNTLTIPSPNVTQPGSPSTSLLHRRKDNSALYYHVANTKHNIDIYNMDNTKILCRENNLTKRLIKEMLHINNTNNTINKRIEIDDLSRIYNQIMN